MQNIVERKLEHINRVLRATRNINRLIIRDTDSDGLLKGVCDNLVNICGYYNAWIVMLDESGKLFKFAETGWGKEFLPMVERLKHGELPHCAQEALRQTDIVVIEHPSFVCPDCHQFSECVESRVMSVRLQRGSRAYGVAFVSIPVDFSKHIDDFGIFQDFADDIAFALQNIELKETQKLVEKALQKSEKRYRLLFENSLDGVYTSTPKGRFINVNSALVRMLGYETKEDLLSISIPEDVYVSESDRPSAAQRNGIFRSCFKKNDGARINVEINSRVFYDEKDEPVYYENIIRDITDREKLEKPHDFNNILAVMIWGTELALDRIPEGSPARSNLKQVLDATDRAKDLVSQILAFSRQGNPEPKPVQIGYIVKEALRFLRASLPATIEIRNNIKSMPGTVLADATQVYQVVMNLCVNAAHAMRDSGGVLGVSLENVDIDAGSAAQYLDLKPGPFLRLTVRDTGHGMNRKVRGRIFDPFFTTKGPAEGTGMGLAVVHGIVKSCGGAIKVKSEPGNGSVFQIFFPRFYESATPEIEMLDPLPTGNEQILFVDDEQVLAKMGQKILQDLGYKVFAKSN
ncbi:MAG: PAS domain S-box protein, partial [Deltaproteobacteria bacterium]|nr:PAS domain S-box protein [Deltaproteobacteria bacterium]